MCARCHEVDEDRRTLYMARFYNMSELGLPFIGDTTENKNFCTLRVCKQCRAEWMTAIKDWFHAGKRDMPSCGSGIYIRRNGATIEITQEEWNALHPGTEPVRFKDV